MTIKECIDIVDNIKPNQYSVKNKVQWLSFIDGIIINEVLKTHEGYDGRYDDFEGYSEDKLSVVLIVPAPYDRLYTAYLKMKIDGENGETARYNNSAELFNTYMMEYRKHYNKTHMPLDVTNKDSRAKQGKGKVALSESVIENIKRDLYAMLSEDVAKQTSYDRINSIVISYMQNNVAMLKGKNGETPIKGVHYFDGTNGIGIARITQPVTSSENGGTNTILVTMTDGSTYRFYIKNGEKGNKPVVGVDYYTANEKLAFKGEILKEVEGTLNEIKDKIIINYITPHGVAISELNKRLDASIEHIDSVAEKVDASEKSISEIKSTAYRLIRRLIVEEDVSSVIISKDEEGNSFKLTDFEVRFSGSHTGTMWIQLNKGEKYFSANQVANNQGLPFYPVTNWSMQNAVAHYTYSGSNYYGAKYRQSIGALDETTGKYATGAGEIQAFSTSPVSSLASTITVKAVSGGVLNSGSVIEVWGY